MANVTRYVNSYYYYIPIGIVLQARHRVTYKLMKAMLPKILFLPEILLNGIFIVLCLLSSSNNIPPFWDGETVHQLIQIGSYVVPFAILTTTTVNFIQINNFPLYFRHHFFSLIVLIPLFLVLGDSQFAFG